MAWEIRNVNNWRWGSETYPSRAEAEKELRSFFKGVPGVRLDRFSFHEVSTAAPAPASGKGQ